MENTTQTQTPTPKAPRTQAQIEASRRNGAKSNGPVTDEGKAISARNAQRHQIFAQITTISGEARADYVQLSSELYETWCPTDEHERILVDTMATCIWRRMRVLAMESVAFDVQLEKAGVPAPAGIFETFNAFNSLAQESRAFQLLHQYESRYLRAYERASRALLSYRKTQKHEELPEPTPELDQAPTQEPEIQNPKNEPEPASTQPRNRRERRQLKWQKAHPKHVPTAPNPRGTRS